MRYRHWTCIVPCYPSFSSDLADRRTAPVMHGATTAGSGFTCTRMSEGVYEILFTQTFAGQPTLEVTVFVAFSGGGPDRPVYAHFEDLTQTHAIVRILNGRHPLEPYTNSDFSFWAIGPR